SSSRRAAGAPRRAPSAAAAAGRSGTWRQRRNRGRGRCSRRSPFFPAGQGGLPDVVGQGLSGIAELVFDGADLLGFGGVEGSFDELTDDLFDLGSQLVHQGFDPFFAAWGPGRVRRRASHGCLRIEETGWDLSTSLIAYRRLRHFPPK